METSRKKIIIIAVLVILILALAISGYLYYKFQKQKQRGLESDLVKQEQEIKERVESVREARDQYMEEIGMTGITEEDISSRVEAVSAPSSKQKISEEEIKLRMEALKNLR